jgi:hypothetical protein
LKNNTAPFIVANLPTPAAEVSGGFTFGLDLDDRSHHVCEGIAIGVKVLFSGTFS